jgi:hypothetical protein
MHGFGVRPAAWSARYGSTTPARNSSRSVAHRARRAAAALAVVLRVAPQLEGDGHGLRARPRGEKRRDGGVDAAGHRDQDALAGASKGSVPFFAGGLAERDVHRVGGEVGGVQLAGAQPAELAGDL